MLKRRASFKGTVWGIGCATFGAAIALTPVAAQDASYAGQQIRVIVASGPAGGFDTYARLLARFMGDFVPGKPSFVVQNMAGAGGLRAANYLAKVASKDGATIGALHPGTVKAPLMGQSEAAFDPSQFGWIGSLNSEIMVCVSWRGSGVESLSDVMSKQLIVGGAGVANDSAQIPAALNYIIGTKFKIVPGYADGPSILLAMQRQEVAGRCGWSWSSVVVQHPDWIKDKTINVLLQLPTRHKDLPHVPLATEFAKDARSREALDFLFGHLAMSRAYALPPGAPAERLEILRAAFDKMVQDVKVVAEFERINQELSPVSGTEIQRLVKRFYDAPREVVDLAKKAVQAEQ